MIIEVKQDVERVKFGSLQLGATFRLQASANISDLWLKITTRPPAGAVGVRVLGADDVKDLHATDYNSSGPTGQSLYRPQSLTHRRIL